MKILVIGCGSIGKRHIRNLKELLKERDGEVVAFDVNKEALDFVNKEYGVRTFDDIDKALKEADGAFICTPNSLHVPIALKAVKNNCHVLIEKPLSHTMENVDELLKIAKEKNLTVTVGYMMRFYNPLKKVKELLDNGAIGKIYGIRVDCGLYLPYWRPTQDYRKNYGAIKAQGGGAILDIIHEINYIKWLLGNVKELFCFAGKLSDLEIDTEDFAEIMMRFGNNVIASVHLDYLQKNYTRNIKIIGEKGTITWDFNGHVVKFYNDKKKEWETFKEDIIDFNTIYLKEEEHFLKCVEGKEKPVVSGEEAKEDLRVALVALESFEKGKVIKFND